jgi:phosphate transport system substrate-binding protein
MNFKHCFLAINILLAVILTSCGSASDALTQESTTRGNIRIGVDDSYKLLLETEISTFQSLYPNAKINATYGSEGNLMDLLMKDSLRAIITSRELTEQEKVYFKSHAIFPKVTKICVDGLAFIVNRSNPDSTFSYKQLQQLFTKNPSTWLDIKPSSSKEEIRVVLVRYMKQAVASHNTTLMNRFNKAGHPELVKLLEI